MRGIYLYDDVDVLRNLGNIRDAKELRRAEGNITSHTILMVFARRFKEYGTETLCEIHRIIFDKLYDWAGKFRLNYIFKKDDALGGDMVRYASPGQIGKELDAISKEIKMLNKCEPYDILVFKLVRIAVKIWQIHPFRKGNTRTVIAFIALLAESLNIDIDYSVLDKHAPYVRTAFVRAVQGPYSDFEQLERIFFDVAGIPFLIGDGAGCQSGLLQPV
jgi:cell filamentation protein